MVKQQDDAKVLHDFYDQAEANHAVKKQKKRNKKKTFFTIFYVLILFTLAGVFILFADMMHAGYAIRTRLAEGLALASSAKNLVIDNIVNGFSPAEGWVGIQPTENTQAIMIDKVSGVIYIVGDPQRTGGVVLALIPVDHKMQPLVVHEIPQGAIYWACRTVTLGNTHHNQIPSECRTMLSEKLEIEYIMQ